MFMLTQSVYNVNEGDGTAEVCVELTSGSASRSITINLGTSDISAVGEPNNFCQIQHKTSTTSDIGTNFSMGGSSF